MVPGAIPSPTFFGWFLEVCPPGFELNGAFLLLLLHVTNRYGALPPLAGTRPQRPTVKYWIPVGALLGCAQSLRARSPVGRLQW